MKMLIVLTSVSCVPGTDHKTGTWLEELAAPYYVFMDAGATVTLASVQGGAAPLDPLSEAAAAQTAETRRFLEDPVARAALENTMILTGIDPADYAGQNYNPTYAQAGIVGRFFKIGVSYKL